MRDSSLILILCVFNMPSFKSVFNPGDRVILGKHQIGANSQGQSYGTFWSISMEAFVGKEAVLQTCYNDPSTVAIVNHPDSPLWKVDIDAGAYFWREINMTPIASTNAQVISTNSTMNNFTCPTCKNKRCNSMEQICWSCGNPLHSSK